MMKLLGIAAALAAAVAAGSAAPVAAQDSAAVAVEAPAGPRVAFTVDVEGEDGRLVPFGTVVIEVDAEAAPKHAANFVKLAKDGFYTGTVFHRVVPGFIVEGGDPLSRADWTSPRIGTGGPGHRLEPEFGLKHVRGAVAASRASESAGNETKESNGSVFFICLSDLPSLDSTGYSVFGQVVQGMDVIDKIARVKNAGAKNRNRALQRVVISKAEVTE